MGERKTKPSHGQQPQATATAVGGDGGGNSANAPATVPSGEAAEGPPPMTPAHPPHAGAPAPPNVSVGPTQASAAVVSPLSFVETATSPPSVRVVVVAPAQANFTEVGALPPSPRLSSRTVAARPSARSDGPLQPLQPPAAIAIAPARPASASAPPSSLSDATPAAAAASPQDRERARIVAAAAEAGVPVDHLVVFAPVFDAVDVAISESFMPEVPSRHHVTLSPEEKVTILCADTLGAAFDLFDGGRKGFLTQEELQALMRGYLSMMAVRYTGTFIVAMQRGVVAALLADGKDTAEIKQRLQKCMGPLAKLARVTARVVTRRRDSITRRTFGALDSRHDGRVTRPHFLQQFYGTLQNIVDAEDMQGTAEDEAAVIMGPVDGYELHRSHSSGSGPASSPAKSAAATSPSSSSASPVQVYISPEERAAMAGVAQEFAIPVEHVQVFKPIFDVVEAVTLESFMPGAQSRAAASRPEERVKAACRDTFLAAFDLFDSGGKGQLTHDDMVALMTGYIALTCYRLPGSMLATLRNGMRVALLADGTSVDRIKSQLQEMMPPMEAAMLRTVHQLRRHRKSVAHDTFVLMDSEHMGYVARHTFLDKFYSAAQAVTGADKITGASDSGDDA